MAEAVMNITDIELVRLLKASYIAPEQIKELQPLIPEMTAEDRQQLMALIDQSHEEAEKAEIAYQERLRDLNAQYGIELDNLVKETSAEALKDAKELEVKEETQELKEIESEMDEMSSDTKEPESVQHAKSSEYAEGANPIQKPKRNRHVIAKLIVIFIFILIILGIAIYSNLHQ